MTKINILRLTVILSLSSILGLTYAADLTPAKIEPKTPVSAEPSQQTQNKAIGAWQLTCTNNQASKTNKKDDCIGILRITQQVEDPSEKDPKKTVAKIVLAWIISKAPSGKLMTSIETPLGVVIQPGVQLVLDKSSPKTIAFTSCGTQSCSASTVMNEAFLKQARAATKVEMKIQTPVGKAFAYTFEPTGIKDLIKAIE
jgi:invasion protein IalB